MKISENWLRERVAISADHDALVERLNMIGHESKASIASAQSRRRRRRADRRVREASGGRSAAGLQGRRGQRRSAPGGLWRAERTSRIEGAFGDDRHESRRTDDQGGEAARRRVVRDAVLGEGTRHRCRRLRSARTGRRRAGRQAAGRLSRSAGQRDRRPDASRADCLSIVGIASDVGAAFDVAASALPVPAVAPTSQRTIAVKLPADCPRYCGRYRIIRRCKRRCGSSSACAAGCARSVCLST